MSKKSVIIVCLLIVLALGGWLIFGTPKTETPPRNEAEEQAVKAIVEDFGHQLQKVSLLDEATAADQITEHYGPYLTADQLSQWQQNPSWAPGRLTSSPWPDRIEINRIDHIDYATESQYQVTGNIVEVTNEGGGIGEAPTEAGRRPISLAVQKIVNEWKIGGVDLGIYVGQGNWVLSESSSQGLQFMYPDPFPTNYVIPVEWPPQVDLANQDFNCPNKSSAAPGETAFNLRQIGDRTYCVATTYEGAAGSRYATYTYSTRQSNFLASVTLTLRFPQCENFEEDEQGTCFLTQQSLDIDGLADRIISSLRRP